MTTNESRSNTIGLILGVILAIGAFLVFRTAVPRVITTIRDANKPAWERALMRAIAAQNGTAEFESWVQTLTPGAEAIEAGMRVSRRGLLRLSSSDQLLRMQILARRLRAAAVSECGPLARGTMTQAQSMASFDAMDPADLEALAGLAARAMLAEMRADPPGGVATPDDQAAFFIYLQRALGPADWERWYAVAPVIATASDADVCWFNRAFYDAAIAATEPDRERWVRVITSLESAAPLPAMQ